MSNKYTIRLSYELAYNLGLSYGKGLYDDYPDRFNEEIFKMAERIRKAGWVHKDEKQ